ncbi:hypothetical protein HK102_012363, partial [Quaeritorhiza haematococci]
MVHAEVKKLLEMATGPVNIAFTGHSLGGALARLAALEFNMKNIPFNDMYIYGAPRVGDDEFEAVFEATKAPGQNHAFIVTVNTDNGQVDPVTLVPFGPGILDYSDMKQPRYVVPCLNEQGNQCNPVELHNMHNY